MLVHVGMKSANMLSCGSQRAEAPPPQTSSCLVNDRMAAFVFKEREDFMNEKSCITINCGCCGNGDNGTTPTPVTGDGTPIGTVIAYMGTKAPMHYLVCDGSVLNRENFPVLAQQIQDEFGLLNYFGGDGIESFAVPDLRNEFLRGYRCGAVEQMSGEIGQHQDATQLPGLSLYSNGDNMQTLACCYNSDKSNNAMKYADIMLRPDGNRMYQDVILSPLKTSSTGGVYGYTSRPTNVAVLYCIKYE